MLCFDFTLQDSVKDVHIGVAFGHKIAVHPKVVNVAV